MERPPFDRYTWLHIGAGAALAQLGASAGQMLALAAAWEALEMPFLAWGPESASNMVVDTAAVVVGYWLWTEHAEARL